MNNREHPSVTAISSTALQLHISRLLSFSRLATIDGDNVGLVAINVQQPLTIAAAAAGVAPTMCTHPRCQRLAATFVEEVLELVAPFLPINRQQESIANRE